MAPSPTRAADPKSIGPWPYVTHVGGETADLLTTLQAIQSGLGTEGTPWLRHPAALVGAKVGGTLMLALIMRHLDKTGHDKAAKLIGYLNGAAKGAVAVHNARVRPGAE